MFVSANLNNLQTSKKRQQKKKPFFIAVRLSVCPSARPGARHVTAPAPMAASCGSWAIRGAQWRSSMLEESSSVVPSLEQLSRRVPAAAAAFPGSISSISPGSSVSSASTSQHCSGALQMLGEKAHGKSAHAPQAHTQIYRIIYMATLNHPTARKQIKDVFIDV